MKKLGFNFKIRVIKSNFLNSTQNIDNSKINISSLTINTKDHLKKFQTNQIFI